MKRPHRARIALERLEVRWCPTAMGQVFNGSLVITDKAAASLTISQTGANNFHVMDGATLVGDFTGVTKDVDISLSDAGNNVAIDLGGNTAPRDIHAWLGNGANSASIGNGKVAGEMTIASGKGTDTVMLGTMATTLTVMGPTFLGLGGQSSDTVSVEAGTVLNSALGTFAAGSVTLDAASTVHGSVIAVASPSGGMLTANGTVDGSLVFWGSNEADALTLGTTGLVGQNLLAGLFGGNNLATISGHVGFLLFIDAGSGDDTVDVSGSVGHLAGIRLGDGNNVAVLSGTVGTNGSLGELFLSGGSGRDTVTVATSASVSTFAFIGLGAGDDMLVLSPRLDRFNALVDGGPGSDTFQGNRLQLRFMPRDFENFSI